MSLEPKLSACGVARYFYGVQLQEGGSKFNSESTSFALAALTTPELITSPRVFAFPDREDRFVNSQVRQMLRETGDRIDFEIGLLYLSDMSKSDIEKIFKDAYVEFSEQSKGELHLLTLAENGILNISLGNLQNGTLGGALAGEPSGRIGRDTLQNASVEAFLTMMDIGPADDGIKGGIRSAFIRQEKISSDRETSRPSEVTDESLASNAKPQATHAVRLTDAGSKKINVMRAIREIFGSDLKDAKDMVESAPTTVATGLTKVQAFDASKGLEEAGATVEILSKGDQMTKNNNKNFDGGRNDSPVLGHQVVEDFLESISDKILERGMLTKFIGVNDFDVRIGIEFYESNGSQNLKILLKIDSDENLNPLSVDCCDDIQDLIIDYLKEKGINDILIEAGMSSDSPMEEPEDLIDRVQVVLNGMALY